MGALARAFDWDRTPVGPVARWPQSLRTAVSILLESRFPMLLCWGPDFVQFYNDPFRPILGQSKHPALGRTELRVIADLNAIRLLRLVNTLQDFSRIEAGWVDASLEETDLAQLTR